MKYINVVGIDLAKNLFQICGMNKAGKVIFNRSVSREKLPETMVQLPSCRVAMEACCGSHYWARTFQSMGHEVKLISPCFVKPFVKSNKNDHHDAEAIAIAANQPQMRFVPVKSIDQQAMQSLHRGRELLLKQRIATTNHIRGVLLEHGIAVPQGARKVLKDLWKYVDETGDQLPVLVKDLLYVLYEHANRLDKQLEEWDKKILVLAKTHEETRCLMEIPGIGHLTATALMASIGRGHEFRCGREVAAFLGLVPRQHSSGGKTVLLGISKRGDRYLRKLLVHGARSVIAHRGAKKDRQSLRLNEWVYRLGYNKAAVALANRNARVAWALLASGESYRVAA